MTEQFPRMDVGRCGYISGCCPNCGRERLELYIDGEEHRAVGIACEKCGAQWLLDPAAADFHGEFSETNPLKPIAPPPSDAEENFDGGT